MSKSKTKTFNHLIFCIFLTVLSFKLISVYAGASCQGISFTLTCPEINFAFVYPQDLKTACVSAQVDDNIHCVPARTPNLRSIQFGCGGGVDPYGGGQASPSKFPYSPGELSEWFVQLERYKQKANCSVSYH